MTAWNSISQDQLTRDRQITWILLMCLVKKKSIYIKNTRDRTAAIHMYMSPFLVGVDHLRPSQHFSSFAGWTFTGSSCRPLCQVIDMQQRLRGEELTQLTHTGYIPTKAWQHAGWATLRLLSLPRNETTWAWSITREPSDEAILLPQNPVLSFSFTKTREKTVSVPRSDTLVRQQPY